ncbi:Interference hedgehog [Armadillidium nasatum]|uniref:Interference hedgehog n=1 Tax=Armadillidium nasatum TaxID=96803 RepID=A0A5N5SME7_9CRUS|nr:Interference hedgehog [Armadillidium nasatum]
MNIGGVEIEEGGIFISFLLSFSSVCKLCKIRSIIISRSDFGFRFVKSPSWQVVNSGENVTFTCETNLSPDTILWQYNHQFITEFMGPHYSFFVIDSDGPEKNSLTVKLPQDLSRSRQLEGLYQCVVSVGSISLTSLPGRLEIAYIKPYDEEAPLTPTLEIEEGNVFRISCGRPESFPRSHLRFFHNGNLLNVDKGESYHLTKSGDLVVLNADQSSKGTYTCEAYNNVANLTVVSPIKTKVVIKKKVSRPSSPRPPRVATIDSEVEVKEGDKARLLCLCVHCEGKLYWTRRGSDYAIKSTNDNKSNYLILEVVADKERIYRCHANNSDGYANSNVKLIVQSAPYVIKGPEGQSVFEKSDIVLECIFGGKPNSSVNWVFNGQLLDNSSVFENRVELRYVKKSQAGLYQCFGFNEFGSAEATAVLNVIPNTITASHTPDNQPTYGASREREIDVLLQSEEDMRENDTKKKKKKKKEEKKQRKKFKNNDINRKMIAPSRPNITKVSDESVMVTWESESGNGVPISFFKVQYKVLVGPEKDSIGKGWKTIDEDIPPHIKSFEVTGLKTNHAYRFRVLAAYVNNDNQPGESSKRFLLNKDVKLQPPERAPEILFLLPVDDSSLMVYWKYEAKSETEGFIIYYRESTSAVGYTKVTILNPDIRNYTISHLNPNQPYDFKITSFNIAGASRFSNKEIYRPKVVRSEQEFAISSHILYIALGSGLGFLVLIVITYYTIYSCRKKNADISESKFTDASLRIHRNSAGDLRQQKQNSSLFSDSTDNQIPLLASVQNQNEKKNDLPSPVLQENVSMKENGNVKVGSVMNLNCLVGYFYDCYQFKREKESQNH